MKKPTDRSPYWDIVKGLGIIAIVLGHTGIFAGAFVYLWHLAIFFFITGFLYNEAKYGDKPFLYFGVRLSGAWPKYMFYTVFFVLTHNFFVTHGLNATSQEIYNHTKMLTVWMQSITFQCPEQVQGALWFVPVWLVSSALFGGCVWFGRHFSKKLSTEGLKLPLIILASLGLGAIGFFLNLRSMGLPYQMQAGLLVVPIYLFAYLLHTYVKSWKSYLPWYGILISAAFLIFCNEKLHIFVDIASMRIAGPMFYVVAIVGIYFCLSLANLIEKIPYLSLGIARLGKQSFDIMALHFFLFKLMDFAYAKWILKSLPEHLSDFPVSFRGPLGIWYVLLGLLIPTLIGMLVDKISRTLS